MLIVLRIMLLLECLMLTLHNGKKRNYYASVKKGYHYALLNNEKKRNYYASVRS